jgi:excisionase family DNA binding protein
MSQLFTGNSDLQRGRMRPVGYTIEEVAAMLRISRNAAYAMVAKGDIPSLRVGRLLRVPVAPFHTKFGGCIPT